MMTKARYRNQDDVTMHHTLDYATRIRERGYRLTPQRELTLDAICEGHGPTTFDEIFARVRSKAPAVDPSTVYRTLNFFIELQLVVAAEVGEHRVYEIAAEMPYYRLICRGCGKFVHLDQAVAREMFAAAQRHHRFTVDRDHLVLYGLCEACAAAKSRDLHVQ